MRILIVLLTIFFSINSFAKLSKKQLRRYISSKVNLSKVLKNDHFQRLDVKGDPARQVLIGIMSSEPALSNSTWFHDRGDGLKSVQESVLDTLTDLRFILVEGEVPNVKDKGIFYFSEPLFSEKTEESIKPVAVQFYRNRSVFVNRALYSKMSDRDKAAFFLHEALIRMWYESNVIFYHSLKSTDSISDIVSILFDESREKEISAFKLGMQMCRAELNVAPELYNDYVKKEMTGDPKKDGVDFIIFDMNDCLVRKFRRLEVPYSRKTKSNFREVKVWFNYFYAEEFLDVEEISYVSVDVLWDGRVHSSVESDHDELNWILREYRKDRWGKYKKKYLAYHIFEKMGDQK